MKIEYRNPKETFKKYYGRFSNIISPLSLANYYKIKLLKNNIIERLSIRILKLVTLRNINFSNFYINLKATDIDLYLYNIR